jgi:hypothetical protein
MTAAELRAQLTAQSEGLETKGVKTVLLARLRDHVQEPQPQPDREADKAAAPAAGGGGMTAKRASWQVSLRDRGGLAESQIWKAQAA